MERFQQNLDRRLLRRESADGEAERIKPELSEERLDFTSSPPAPTLGHPGSATCTDRADLIKRLKRGENPTWIPHRHFAPVQWSQQESQAFASASRGPTHANTGTALTSLLPPHTITTETDWNVPDDETRCQDVLKIERPRSALHSGDFTHDEASPGASPSSDGSFLQTTDPRNDHSWIASSSLKDLSPLKIETGPLHVRSTGLRSSLSSLSSPVLTNFLYKPPTSPLFQSESNDEIELVSPLERINLSTSPSRQHRQIILPYIPDSYGLSQGYGSFLRQERTFCQAHQPRRSLTASSTFSTSGNSPHTPVILHARRPSIPTDASPLHHACMVGSYEESILHGRMSTTPSKPLDFLAQIGVLGLGKCKSSLRCPPHVTLSFPAVFYSYASSPHGRSKGDDGPSPYVGQIDLENGLQNQEDEARLKRKKKSRTVESIVAEADAMSADQTESSTSSSTARKTPKRRSESPRPPQGSYRIPEKGQIQIIIKNPNKTAVKLFLVPYDLAGMEPGTKTFVRQRSYSNGPIIDNVPGGVNSTPSADRPILRYLVHLHICCPSRGRFFLYKNIRVVFANRVPDGKEKLRNEITLPEPRFTPYKATRATHPPSSRDTDHSIGLVAGSLMTGRDSTAYLGNRASTFGVSDGIGSPSLLGESFPPSFVADTAPLNPVAFMVSRNQTRTPQVDWNGVRAEFTPSAAADSRNSSNWGGDSDLIDHYSKLNKGDVGYGGNAFSGLINGNPVVAESLLSQRLRSLGVPKEDSAEESGEKPTPISEE